MPKTFFSGEKVAYYSHPRGGKRTIRIRNLIMTCGNLRNGTDLPVHPKVKSGSLTIITTPGTSKNRALVTKIFRYLVNGTKMASVRSAFAGTQSIRGTWILTRPGPNPENGSFSFGATTDLPGTRDRNRGWDDRNSNLPAAGGPFLFPITITTETGARQHRIIIQYCCR